MNCQCCTQKIATRNDNEASLNLCDSCTYLLQNMALRPDMWYRLARIIGPNHYLLHDDFYEEDGFPYGSDVIFDATEYSKYRVKRGKPYKSVDAYLNDILTRYLLFENDLEIPSELDQTEIENVLFSEIEGTTVEEFRYKCYQILGKLKSSDSIYNFLKNRWNLDKKEYWSAIATCIIKNYPISDSVKFIEESLINEKWQYPKDSLHVLANYASEFAIDILIKVIVIRKIPLMYDLGAIVRSCNPSWEKLSTMIKNGRPESLIAIDALWIEDSNQYKRYFSNKKLNHIKVSNEELQRLLNEYMKSDSAPRVRTAIESVYNKYKIEQNA